MACIYFRGQQVTEKRRRCIIWPKDLAKNQQVITIEDPVEMEQPAFLQLQINEAIEATYERLVQLCLRHRPDILIVGEIRDEQTARAVVRGALTGHTIFSTVHASDGRGVWLRLIELGVSPRRVEAVSKRHNLSTFITHLLSILAKRNVLRTVQLNR